MYDIPTNEYLIVPHEVAIKTTLDAVKTIPEFEDVLNGRISVRTMFNGAKLFVDFAPDKNAIARVREIKKGDLAGPSVQLRNSYDRSTRLTQNVALLQFWCSNGAMAPVKGASSKMSVTHRQGLDIEALSQEIGKRLQIAADSIGVWTRWSEIKLESDQWFQIEEELPFGKRHKEQILQLPETRRQLTIPDMLSRGDLDAFSANNVLTQFLTHNVSSDEVRDKKLLEVNNIWIKRFGA